MSERELLLATRRVLVECMESGFPINGFQRVVEQTAIDGLQRLIEQIDTILSRPESEKEKP